MTAPVQTATAPLDVAATGRATQVAISAAAMRDATKLWPLLDPKNIDKTFPGWLRAMTLLIRSYHGQSSVAAGRTYRQLRQLHTLSDAPASLIKTAPVPSNQWLTRALGYAGPGQLTRDTARPNTALSTTLGTTARIVQDGGRTTTLDTVHDDPVALGWYRVTDSDPCAFCALLASRGAVYKKTTVGFEAHNHCHCTGAPLFTRSQQLPPIHAEANAVYDKVAANFGYKQRVAEFRKAWDARNQPASA